MQKKRLVNAILIKRATKALSFLERGGNFILFKLKITRIGLTLFLLWALNSKDEPKIKNTTPKI